MSIFKKMANRKHLDDLVDLMNFKNIPLPLCRVQKGEYKIEWFDQDIPAKVPVAPSVVERKLTDYPNMFAYSDYLLDLWFGEFNNMMRSLGCKKQLVVGGVVRNELQTSLILALCNDFNIETPYRHEWPKDTTEMQMAMVMSDRTAGIYFKRHGVEYVANIGGNPSCTLPFAIETLEKGLGYNSATKQCRATKADVAKLGDTVVQYMEKAYNHVFEKHGVKNFALHPETKLYMSRYVASTLCKDYQITE